VVQSTCRFALALVAGLSLLGLAWADDNRDFFQEPTTLEEFWDRIKFEMEVGKFDFAANYLRKFVAKLKDTPEAEANKALVKLEEKDGMSAFLRLNLLPELQEDKKARKALARDVESLLKRVSTAVDKELKDPARINKFIANLQNNDPNVRAWALKELRRSGAAAGPPLVKALADSVNDQRKHYRIHSAVARLDESISPPLVAALDLGNKKAIPLRRDLLDLFRARADPSVVPELWYLAGSPQYPDVIRRKAAETIAYLLHTDVDHLPAPKVALTRLAERYYRHQVKFQNPNAVVVWQYDPNKSELVSPSLPAAQAEEYYGLRYARQALDLDPTYQPAQVVFLSLLLERAYGSDIHVPLSKKAPAVKELMTTISPDLVATVLDRALRDHRLPVILGAIEVLGDLADVPAARRELGGGPVLAKALNYADRRVQFSAADAMLRVPGTVPPVSATRIVQILRRALLADPRPKVLVAYYDQDRANQIAKVVRQAGYEPVVVRSRVAALKRLKSAADIDAILMDYSFPGWEREFPFVLAEMRADIDIGLLPLLVTAPEDRLLRLGRFVQRNRNVWAEPERITGSADELKTVLKERIQEAMGRPLSDIERKEYVKTALGWLGRMAHGEVTGYDLRPAEDAIYKALRSDQVEMSLDAIDLVARLPGADAQRQLAALVLDPTRDKLRSPAAIQLSRHIQQYGLLLTAVDVKRIQELFAETKDAKLKNNLALVIGSLRPSPKITGDRLRDFRPQPVKP
jgi:CheY-like chemotaxis protein